MVLERMVVMSQGLMNDIYSHEVFVLLSAVALLHVAVIVFLLARMWNQSPQKTIYKRE